MISSQMIFMKEAINCAKIAQQRGGTPVGAVIVDTRTDQIASVGYNQVEETFNPTAHAEIVAIEAACKKLQNNRLKFCDLYVTLEPCTLCAAAISYAHIRRLYFGAYDLKSGAVDNGVRFFQSPSCHHRPEIYGGILEQESTKLLKEFFWSKRD